VHGVQMENEKFDVLFHSPLKRATETAKIIWGSRSGPVVVLPSLREVDLYSFQVCITLACQQRNTAVVTSSRLSPGMYLALSMMSHFGSKC
jgi:broad specificity phosphatase PhoE